MHRPYRDRARADAGRRCVDCYGPFALTPGEVRFYELRGLDLPKRCARCRRDRRAARGAEWGAEAPEPVEGAGGAPGARGIGDE